MVGLVEENCMKEIMSLDRYLFLGKIRLECQPVENMHLSISLPDITNAF